MATKFSTFFKELKKEADAEAVAGLRYFRERFRLARRFAEARRKRGWTQKKLAQKTGLNQSEGSIPASHLSDAPVRHQVGPCEG